MSQNNNLEKQVCQASQRSMEPLSGPLPANSSGELDILGHNGHPLSVNGAQVRVLEQPHEVRFGSFLEGQHGGALEAQLGLEVLGDLADESLERQLSDQELGALLVTADFAEGYGTWNAKKITRNKTKFS